MFYIFFCNVFSTDEKPKKIKLVSMPGIEDGAPAENEPAPSTSRATEKKSKNKFKLQDAEISSTTLDNAAQFDFVASDGTRKYLLVKPGGKWSDHEVIMRR